MLTDTDLQADLQALWLTLRLAGVVTLTLLLIGTPLAWWLARTRRWWKGPIGAVVALPLVLPPSVLGFYLLLVMGPQGWVGRLTEALVARDFSPERFQGYAAALPPLGRYQLPVQSLLVAPENLFGGTIDSYEALVALASAPFTAV